LALASDRFRTLPTKFEPRKATSDFCEQKVQKGRKNTYLVQTSLTDQILKTGTADHSGLLRRPFEPTPLMWEKWQKNYTLEDYMESTNHPIRKENDLPNLSVIMFHVNLQGCTLPNRSLGPRLEV